MSYNFHLLKRARITMNFCVSTKVFLVFTILGTAFSAAAQSDTLQEQIARFKANMNESHKIKTLNLDKRNLGSIYDTDFEWRSEFRLDSREKIENNLGYKTDREVYFNIFEYATELDRQYALKFWMESFIEGKSIRASRPVRSYEYAIPTIILINPTNIVIANYECKYYDYNNFKFWKEKMLEHFGTDNTMVIEIECDGPLEWTINAPDPKTRGLF